MWPKPPWETRNLFKWMAKLEKFKRFEPLRRVRVDVNLRRSTWVDHTSPQVKCTLIGLDDLSLS